MHKRRFAYLRCVHAKLDILSCCALLPPWAFIVWYTAFGDTKEHSGLTVFALQYVGQLGYWTDGGLDDVYVRRRVYRAPAGRWLSSDPTQEPRTTVPEPRYVYVYNSPCLHRDPSGLQTLLPPIIGGPIIFNYGFYCGLNARGPGIAIDCVDAACEQHDIGLMAWSGNPFTLKCQNLLLCIAVQRCYHPLFLSSPSCYDEPTTARVAACLAAGAQVAAWACMATVTI